MAGTARTAKMSHLSDLLENANKMLTNYWVLEVTERHEKRQERTQTWSRGLLLVLDTVGVRGSRPLAPAIGGSCGVGDCTVFVFSASVAFSSLGAGLVP